MDDLEKRLRGYGSNRVWPHGPACDCTQAAAYIEALEARVAAADKLAEEMTRLIRRTPFVPAPNGIAVTITVDQIADHKAALAAYEATKEPSE